MTEAHSLVAALSIRPYCVVIPGKNGASASQRSDAAQSPSQCQSLTDTPVKYD